jgi:hypothetical protein
MKRTGFPPGWNEARVQRVLEHYERQNQDEAVAEDEAEFRSRTQTVMVVPKRLVPAITRLIERKGSHAAAEKCDHLAAGASMVIWAFWGIECDQVPMVPQNPVVSVLLASLDRANLPTSM